MGQHLNAKIPSTRLDSETFDLMNKVIQEFNENDSGMILTQQSFIRQAIKFYANKLLAEGLSIKFKPLDKRPKMSQGS